MNVSDPVPAELLASDLLLVLNGALQNNRHLLSPIEQDCIGEIASLPENSRRLLVRLLDRKGPGIRLDAIHYDDVDSPEEALALLMQRGLLVELAHGWTRTGLFSVAELKAVLRNAGLPVSGKKDELVERVAHAGFVPEGRVVALLVRDLVRRCEWIFFGRPGVSRKRFLLERLGRQKWMDYRLSPSNSPFADRQALLRYERLWKAPLEAATLVRELSSEGPASAHPWASFSVQRLLERRLEQLAKAKEGQGAREEAIEIYRALLYLQKTPSSRVQRRLALCLEAVGRPEEGAEICQAAVSLQVPEDASGLARTGRRLARKAGVSWRPPRPLLIAPLRRVGLHSDAKGWLGQGIPVERAVMSHLGERRVAWREGGLWTSLFVLLCFDLLWDPAPGMLPAPCLPGPVDLGRPGFGRRRGKAFGLRLELIEGGNVEEIIQLAFQYRGVRVRGLDWRIAEEDEWISLVRALPAKGLRRMVERLAEVGFQAARGLPDLVIWPGEATKLRHSLPAAVAEDALLVEVKGPTDQLREEQEGWHHRLLDWGFFVETWRVEELGKVHESYRRPASRAAASSPERKQRPTHLGSSPGGPLFDSWAGLDGL